VRPIPSRGQLGQGLPGLRTAANFNHDERFQVRIWTNRARLIDVGCNWYLNTFVKVCAGWERATFATPVVFAPGRPQTSGDLFWLRTQI
jgi:hypothetical protein